MRVPGTELTAREGIYHVGLQTVRTLKWIFREEGPTDVGIDAQVEIVRAGRATGSIIGLQIKAGASYFAEPDAIGFVFRGDKDHLAYWSTHVLPVIVILYDPTTRLAYWQAVTDETVTETNGGWKITIPKDQPFDSSAQNALRAVAQRKFEVLSKSRESAQKPLLELALGERRLLLEVREWVNESSGRGDIRIVAEEEDGMETIVDDWTTVLLGPTPYAEALPKLFPWADLAIDEGYYSVHAQDDMGWLDGATSEGLQPYDDDGEIAYWRLELRPNVIHQAHRIMSALPENDPDRMRWFQLLEQAEMTHQAEPALRAEAERIVRAYGG